MSNDNTLACEGIITRSGLEIAGIFGFGHEKLAGHISSIRADDGRVAGHWWAVVRFKDDPPDRRREYPLSGLVYREDDPRGETNMLALSAACMDYLHENGEFTSCGKWIPKAA